MVGIFFCYLQIVKADTHTSAPGRPVRPSKWRARLASIAGLLLICMGCLPLPAQVEEGPDYKIPHHRRILQFLRGGDGAYYLMLSSSGSSGRFSRNGESAFVLHRFGPDLVRTHKTRINRSARLADLPNAYAVLPSPAGIAFLNVQRYKTAGAPFLALSEITYSPGEEEPRISTRDLGALPGHTPGITNPNIRITWAPDSSLIAISWRLLSRYEDNSLAVLWLDRELRVLGDGPAFPLQKFSSSVLLKEILLDGYGNLVMHVQTRDPAGLANSGGAGSSGFVFHERQRDSTSKVLMAPLRMIPLSLSSYTDPEIGLPWMCGIYASYEADSLVIGLYRGLVSWEETMNFLELWPFEEAFSEVIVNNFRERDQQLSYRRLNNDMALGRLGGGFDYLLLLSGGGEGFLKNGKGMGRQTLLALSASPEAFAIDTLLTAVQPVYEEFRQMNGYGPFPQQEALAPGAALPRPILLLNDYGGARSSIRPYGTQLLALDMEAEGFATRQIRDYGAAKQGFGLVAVQHQAPGDRRREWIYPSRFRTSLRLVRINFGEK